LPINNLGVAGTDVTISGFNSWLKTSVTTTNAPAGTIINLPLEIDLSGITVQQVLQAELSFANSGPTQPKCKINIYIKPENSKIRKVFEDDFSVVKTFSENGTVYDNGDGWNVMFPNLCKYFKVVESNKFLELETLGNVKLKEGDYKAPFLYRSTTGDFSVIMKMHEPYPLETWSNVGILARDPDWPASTNYFFYYNFPYQLRYLNDTQPTAWMTWYIDCKDGNISNPGLNTNIIPAWLRLDRVGSSFVMYGKTNEFNNWTK